MPSAPRWLFVVALCAVFGIEAGGGNQSQARADQTMFLDSDGDMLPDTLEWVLLTSPGLADTNGDGADDFLSAVQHRMPFGTQQAPPMDHAMRAVVSTERNQTGQVVLVINLLFRIVNGSSNGSQVTGLTVFAKAGVQTEIGIDDLFAVGIAHFATKVDPVEGTYLIASAVLGPADQLRTFLPCSFGAAATIGQKPLISGSVLDQTDGTVFSFVPDRTDHFVMQPIDPKFSPDDPFWQRAHTCELELVQLGGGGGSSVCQVTDAGCTGAPTLVCAPSCESWNGRLVVVPTDISFLTGQ